MSWWITVLIVVSGLIIFRPLRWVVYATVVVFSLILGPSFSAKLAEWLEKSGFICWCVGHAPSKTIVETKFDEGFWSVCAQCGKECNWSYGKSYADIGRGRRSAIPRVTGSAPLPGSGGNCNNSFDTASKARE